MSEGIPLHGDRAVYNCQEYPLKHTNDTDIAANSLHHTLGSGQYQAASGTHTHTPPTKYVTFTYTGNLTTTAVPHRLYNISGSTRTITQVHISVNTTCSGQAIIIDVHLNGSTIFITQGNRPSIAVGTYTGSSTNIDTTQWASGSYLQYQIDQIGTPTTGADLVVQIAFTE